MNFDNKNINITNFAAVVVSFERSQIHSSSTHSAKIRHALPKYRELIIGLLLPLGSQEYSVFTDLE